MRGLEIDGLKSASCCQAGMSIFSEPAKDSFDESCAGPTIQSRTIGTLPYAEGLKRQTTSRANPLHILVENEVDQNQILTAQKGGKHFPPQARKRNLPKPCANRQRVVPLRTTLPSYSRRRLFDLPNRNPLKRKAPMKLSKLPKLQCLSRLNHLNCEMGGNRVE